MSVGSRQNAAGDVSIGVVIEGAFVPFLTLSAAKVAQHVERYNTLKERAEAGDAQAKAVLGKEYGPPGGRGASEEQPSGEPSERWTVAQLDAYADEHDVDPYPASGTKAEKLAAIASASAGGSEE